jgi:cytochrome c oxidase cbb3-type subunit 3/ubiquinol-cytochrome c reductase cytochrome c subunit
LKGSAQHSFEGTGSIVDPAYLALMSDQSLRSTIIVGRPDEHMPDWRTDASDPNTRAMTDQEITDTVAWLASKRIATPGQPYQLHE